MQKPHRHEYFNRADTSSIYSCYRNATELFASLPVIPTCPTWRTLIPEVLPPPRVLGDILASVIISHGGVATMCNYTPEEVLDQPRPSAGRGVGRGAPQRCHVRFSGFQVGDGADSVKMPTSTEKYHL